MKTLSKRVLRKMGYFADRRGIADRFLHHAGDWDNHLKCTKDFVLRRVKDQKVRNLAILGSGWMLDLPPDEISHAANHVYLYDIIHPPQIIHKIRNYENISAVADDLTGGAVQKAYQAVQIYRGKGIKPDICEIVQDEPQLAVDVDYVVSLNVLSQLGGLICEYLVRYIPYDEAELNELNRKVQAAHLRLLSRTRSCLITDYKEVAIDSETGKQEIRKMVFTDVPQSGRMVKWDWKFDASGGYYPGKEVILKVLATELQYDGLAPHRQGAKEIR